MKLKKIIIKITNPYNIVKNKIINFYSNLKNRYMKIELYKKNIMMSSIMLLLSVIILTTVTFGWFYLNNKPGFNSFDVKVVRFNSLITFDLDLKGTKYNELSLNDVYPTKEYEFIIKIENLINLPTTFSVYFYGLLDDLEETGDLHMEGIFKIRVGTEPTSSFFRQKMQDGKVMIGEDVALGALEKITFTFYLIFSDCYMYSDESITYDPAVINMFQGKEFTIQTLRVEID